MRRARSNRWGTLRLTTTGRRSNLVRSVILGYLEDGPNLVTLAMNGWADGEPAWWLNLQAHPNARVDLVDGPRAVTARAAAGAERSRLWVKWREVEPTVDGCAALRSSETALVILESHRRIQSDKTAGTVDQAAGSHTAAGASQVRQGLVVQVLRARNARVYQSGVVAAVTVLQTLHGLSDREPATRARSTSVEGRPRGGGQRRVVPSVAVDVLAASARRQRPAAPDLPGGPAAESSRPRGAGPEPAGVGLDGVG